MKTLAWGDFCKHDFPFLHIASRKYRFSEKSRPFCPCYAATSLKFPPHRVIGGNLRCCCSAGAAPQGFACGELVYLRSCSRCSFLFFFPPASSFSSPPSFYGAPPPPDHPPTLPPLLSPLPRPPRPRRSPRGRHQTTHVQL